MGKRTTDGYLCEMPNCDREFATMRGMRAHMGRTYHRPIAPPPPVQKVEKVLNALPETHSLLNGRHLEPGDVFYRVEKHVIKSITYTQGSTTVKVESEKLKQNWQSNQPS